MPKKTYDQLVTENKKIKELMTYTSETMRKACDDRYKLQQENEKLKEEVEILKEEVEILKKQKRNLVEGSRKVRKLHSESHHEKGHYIMKLEEENKELKEEMAMWKASYDDDIREARAEGIDELKEEIEEWKEAAKYVNHATIDTPDELESYLSATIHEDDELYSKYMEPLQLREENEELKEDNKMLKDGYEEELQGWKDLFDDEYQESSDAESYLVDMKKLKNKLEELGKRNCILQEQMDKEHVRYMDEVSNRCDDKCEIAKALGIEWHGEIKDIMTTITSLKKSNEYKTKIIRKARKQAQDLLKGDNE
tara:strand:+ start:72 stop:1001 length:930 start_codon:yes stop_codon:yes gene_type:complete